MIAHMLTTLQHHPGATFALVMFGTLGALVAHGALCVWHSNRRGINHGND